MGEVPIRWFRTLLLAFALGVAAPAALHAQDDDGEPAGQTVELPRSGGDEGVETASEPEEAPQDDGGQAQDEAETPQEQGGEAATDEAQPGYAADAAAGADGVPSGAPGDPNGTPSDQSGGAGPGDTRGGADPAGGAPGAPGAGRNPGPLEAPPLALVLPVAAVATVGAAALAAKLLMPWPRPRLSCACDVSPASLPSGALTLQPPDIEIRAESTCGAPTLAGDLIIEPGEQHG